MRLAQESIEVRYKTRSPEAETPLRKNVFRNSSSEGWLCNSYLCCGPFIHSLLIQPIIDSSLSHVPK